MFETSRRRHPLNSFRLWFLIIGAMTLTIAWKFDLLPFRIGPAETGRLAEESFQEIEPTEPVAPKQAAEPELSLSFSDEEESLALPTIAPAESDTRTMAADSTAAPSRQAALASSESASQDASTAATSPFGTDMSAFDNWDNDWPSQTKHDKRSKTSESEPILQTHATTTSYTKDTSHSFEAQAQPSATGGDADHSDTDVSQASFSGIDFTQIDALLETGLPADEIEAHRLLSTRYWQQPDSRPALRKRIDTLAQSIYFLSSRHYMEAYQVQPGDTLQSIARQYEVPWQYLAKLNRVDPRKVRAGQRLKVIKGPFSAIVDLSEFELTVHAHGYFVTRFPVGIGKDGSTPIGKFTVQEKLIDPTYYGPDGVIDHDDPANPLGERWIDLGDSYGIHGTIDPASIGKSESRGCIRLHNDDVEAVYDLLTIGSEVTIRP